MKRFLEWIWEWVVLGCIILFWCSLSLWNKIRGKDDDWF